MIGNDVGLLRRKYVGENRSTPEPAIISIGMAVVS
jgi:hypothetical protein